MQISKCKFGLHFKMEIDSCNSSAERVFSLSKQVIYKRDLKITYFMDFTNDFTF
jgi:hypothetical protein